MKNQKKSVLKDEISLYKHQEVYINRIIESIKNTNKLNYFISLPQGAGKTLLSLAIFSELYNKKQVKSALILAPRKVLVDQWVEEAQKRFIGLNILKDPTVSKSTVGKTRTFLKRSGVCAIAMTIHSFKNYIKKKYFRESDFGINKWNDLLKTVFGRINKERKKYIGKEGLERAKKS